MTDRTPLTRTLVAALAAAIVLAACSGGGGSAPSASTLTPAAPQSATRSVADQSNWQQPSPVPTTNPLSADPTSLSFTADEAAAGTPQTVAVTVSNSVIDSVTATIAGTGNCPTVSPAALRPPNSGKHHHHSLFWWLIWDVSWFFDWNKSNDGHDEAPWTATLTVTPAGAGPATCTITLVAGNDDAKCNQNAPTLTIPVTVAAAATPSPTPSPTPTAVPTPTPTATPTAVPTPTPTPGRE
ncbi:MAG: hypothetical protein ABSD03_08075 [Vulcanimicrobiaceae bacterium]|jgi:hypothetical protein